MSYIDLRAAHASLQDIAGLYTKTSVSKINPVVIICGEFRLPNKSES